MNRFFSRNLGNQSRMARGVIGTLLLIAGIIMADFDLLVCLVLVGLGLFAIFEAVRGWSAARAAGLKPASGIPAPKSGDSGTTGTSTHCETR